MKLPHPTIGDIAAALGFLAASEVVALTGGFDAVALAALVPLPAAILLLWRTRCPLAVMAAGGVGVAACALAGLNHMDSLINVVGVTLMSYAVGSHEPIARARVGLALTTVPLLAIAATSEVFWGMLLFGGVVFCAAPWALGRAVRRRAALVRALEETGRELERSRATSTRTAIPEERIWVARELHDVIVRSVAAMTREADAGEEAAGVDSARARAAALEIEATGREALTELRGLLGVLRGDEGPAFEPVPSPRDREVVA